MTRTLSDRVTAALVAWVQYVSRHAGATAALLLGATLVLLPWTATHLGVDSNLTKLLSPDLPFVQRFDEFARLFSAHVEPLYVVVDGARTHRPREAAEVLAERLSQDPAHFRSVQLAGAGAFFERSGILYHDVEDLDTWVDDLARAQPLLAQLERSPRLSTLAKVVERGLDRPSGEREDFTPLFEHLGEAVVQSLAPVPLIPSWDDLLLSGSAFEPPGQQVIVVEPVLDHTSLFAAKPAIDAVRKAAEGFGVAEGLRVRVTGDPALNLEEMQGLVWDVGVSSLVSLALVLALLFLALGSARLVAGAIITLLSGLVLTGAFAAVFLGRLNIVSLTFAVLFIGLGIDFSIHLLLHYGQERRAGAANGPALEAAVRRVGLSLVLCAATTAIGFYAFVPTEYLGMAELGLIAGTGMLVILVLSLTLLPALLALGLGAMPRVGSHRGGSPFWGRALRRFALPICAGFVILSATALLALPGLHFDIDVVSMRDPDTESVQTLRDLTSEAMDLPWQADVVAPDLAAADALAARLRALPSVSRVSTLSDLVPSDQEEKIEILADASMLLAPPSETSRSGEAPDAQGERDDTNSVAALRRLDAALAEIAPVAGGRLQASIALLRDSLSQLFEASERSGDHGAPARRLETLLFGELETQLARLRLALEPIPISLERLPGELSRQMRAESGEARVRIEPRAGLRAPPGVSSFVNEVLTVAPDATGSAVTLVEFARATERATRDALLLAFTAIALVVWLLWRRAADAICALAPLVLGGLITVGAMGVLGMSFNFANVIVLPLLLGVGVDSGIHVVQSWRSGAGPLAAGVTARAIFYSAATTVASFGTLAFSSHRGVASLGLLLTIAMLASLAGNLVFLPAVLELRSRLQERLQRTGADRGRAATPANTRGEQ